METYQKDALDVIRAVATNLSLLPNRALIELWGMYSLVTQNCFWAPCEQSEVVRFAAWVNARHGIKREVVKAHRLAVERKENRAAARRGRPPLRFVMGFDGVRLPDNRVHSNDVRHPEVRRGPIEALMTVHELIDSTNEWCAEHGIVPSSHGSKASVDEPMLRYCCKYEIMDRPGCPDDGRKRGFSQKHASQLRTIRLLQARSLSFKDISSIIHNRPLDQLLQIEREELSLHHGTFLPGPNEPIQRRTGSPRWA